MDRAITLQVGQEYELTHTVQVDANNNPLANPDTSYGPPTYVSSDPAVAFINEDYIETNGVAGTAVITGTEVSSDTSKPHIIGTITVTVTAIPAAGLDLSGGKITEI